MTAPYNWGHPVIRLGAVLDAQWLGPDDDLSISGLALNFLGNQTNFQLRCSTPEGYGELFPPSGATIQNVSDETVISHVRMAGWVSGTPPVPGSTEWLALFQDEGAIPDFQLPIGNARIYDARPISDTEFEFDIRKKGTSNPTKIVRTDYGTISTYNLDPIEAMRCLAGGLKWKHPTFVHSPTTGQFLTQTQRDTALATLLSTDLDDGLNNPWY